MGLFQRFYYGKAGQADFNPEDLPKNRKELFMAMFRIRFSGLITQNLIYLVFCIPAIIICFQAFILLNSIAAAAVEDASLLEQFSRDWFSYAVMLLAILIPCMGLAGVGASGCMYVLRNWARDQHAFGLSDIKDSIKANWKQGLAFGLLTGVIDLVCFVGWYFYRQQAATAGSMTQSVFMSILEGLMIIILCVWWLMNMIAYPMMITYDMKFGALLRNCAILSVARLPQSVGIWLLSLAPTILCVAALLLTGSSWAILAWVLIYLLIGYSFSGFLYASYANALFDKYMNPRIDGAPMNLGLRPSEYDYDEDDDDTPVDAQPGYRPTPGPGGTGEAWPPRRPDSGSWLDAQAERNMPEPTPAQSEPAKNEPDADKSQPESGAADTAGAATPDSADASENAAASDSNETGDSDKRD